MNKISKNEKGFSAVELVLVIVILALIGVVGWMVYKNHHKAPTVALVTSHKTTIMKVAPPTTLETYSNQQGGFTFQYPSTWKNVATVEAPLIDGSFSGVSGVITAPDNTKMVWIFQPVGGKGADCTPNSGDVPFAVGDLCASKQILNVEQLPPLNPASNQDAKILFENGLYITETKYDPGSYDVPSLYPGVPSYAANSISYQICLDPSYSAANQGNPPVVGTTMSLQFPCEYWDTGFNAMYTIKNVSDFNSSDAKTAIQIMKSFNNL